MLTNFRLEEFTLKVRKLIRKICIQNKLKNFEANSQQEDQNARENYSLLKIIN